MRVLALFLALSDLPAFGQDQAEVTPPSDSSGTFVVQTELCSGTLDGFLKIPWGTSVEDVRAAMKGQPAFKDATPQGMPNDLFYVGGKVANLEVKQLQLHFFHGQFESATINFKTKGNDAQTMSDLKDALTQKYGNWYGFPDEPVWKFQDSNTIGLGVIGGELILSYSNAELEASEKTEGNTGINPSGL